MSLSDPWRFQEELEAGREPLSHCEPLDEALFPSLSFPICKMRELTSMISKGRGDASSGETEGVCLSVS